MKRILKIIVCIVVFSIEEIFSQLFAPAVNYPTAENTYSIVAADFNGDGYKDLAATHAGSSSGYGAVFIFINNGDGSFQEADSYFAGEDPTEIVAADFNNDGDIDIAVANHLSDDITLLYNDGNGIFQDHITHDMSNVYTISSIFAADLNNDGCCDIAMTDDYYNHVSVLFNFLDTLIQTIQYDIAYLSEPTSVFAGDLNGDGLKDLAVASRGEVTIFVPGYVTILINNGNRTFTVANEYNLGLGVGLQSIFGGDFDNDGDIDLATANDSYLSVSVLKNNGNGTFQQEVNYGIGGSGMSVFSSDLNGDGYKDLIAAAMSFSSHISILINNSNGTFQTYTAYQAEGDPWSVVAADLDLDGDKDIAVANGWSANISVLLNLSDPTFGGIKGTIKDKQSLIPLRDAQVKIFMIDDYNYKQDVAAETTNSDGQYLVDSIYPGSYIVEVYRNGYYKKTQYSIVLDGYIVTNNFSLELAGFVHDSDYVAGNKPGSIYSSDLNNDGFNDLAVANNYSNDVSILLNKGNGKYNEAVNYEVGDAPGSIFGSDLDGDGDVDLVTANYESNNISVLFNEDNGTFQAAMDYTVGVGPSSVYASDLDQDGDKDLAVTNSYSSAARTLSVLVNEGMGTFQSAVFYPVGTMPTSLKASDFDSDGDNDLAVTIGYTDKVAILKNNGDATFQTAVNYTVGQTPWAVFISDFDNDSDMDLAVANAGSNNVSILKNDGSGNFMDKTNYYAGETPVSVFASDFDGDGFNDLALTTVGNWVTDSIAVLLNNGDATFQRLNNYVAGKGCNSVFASDFDNDGDIDLAISNGSSDNVSVLHNQNILTGMDEPNEILLLYNFSISQNFPNPFNPTTKISWQSPVASHQTLKVYDVLGNEVATLVDEFRNAGSYNVDYNASKLASGVYFYRLQAGDFVQTRKMILLK